MDSDKRVGIWGVLYTIYCAHYFQHFFLFFILWMGLFVFACRVGVCGPSPPSGQTVLGPPVEIIAMAPTGPSRCLSPDTVPTTLMCCSRWDIFVFLPPSTTILTVDHRHQTLDGDTASLPSLENLTTEYAAMALRQRPFMGQTRPSSV